MPSSSLRRHAPPGTNSQTFVPALADNPRKHLVQAQRFLRANDRSGARHAYRQALESASKYRDLAACFLCHFRLAQLSGDNPRAALGHLESAWGLRGHLSEHLQPRDAVGSYFHVVGLRLAGMYAREEGTQRREAEVLRALESMGMEERGGEGGAQSGIRTEATAAARARAAAATVAVAATSAAATTAVVVAVPATSATRAVVVVASTTPAEAAAAVAPAAATPAAAAAAAAGSTAVGAAPSPALAPVVTATPVPAPAIAGESRAREGEGGGGGGGADAGAGGGGGGGGRGEGVNQARQQATGGGQQNNNLSRRGDLVTRRGGSSEASGGRKAVSSCGECGRVMESVCVDEGERGGGGLYCEDCTGAFDKAVTEGPRDDGTPCSGCTDKTQPVTIEPDGKWYCEACIEEFYEDMEAERG